MYYVIIYTWHITIVAATGHKNRQQSRTGEQTIQSCSKMCAEQITSALCIRWVMTIECGIIQYICHNKLHNT